MNSAGYQSLNNHCRDFSGGPVVRGPGLIPDPGAKILQAMWHNQKTKHPLRTPVCSGFEAVS